MDKATWTAVDLYVEGQLKIDDPLLEETLRRSEEAGLPAIHVSPLQGRLLHLLVRATGSRKVLELGTLGGYSTICMARALPEEGSLLSLEVNPLHAEVARTNLARAGLSARAHVRVGPALETLPLLEREGAGPFDLFFLDADKPNNPAYFAWALRLARPGSLILVDNVVRGGRVADEADADANVRAVRELFTVMGEERGVLATAVQTVGRKGYDGLAMAWVVRPRTGGPPPAGP